MSSFCVEIETIDSDDALYLIEQLSTELAKRYEEDIDKGKAAFELSEMDMPGAAFVIARLDRQPIGCGAIRAFDEEGVAEVKRMFVIPTMRGRGISKQILAKLEDTARSFGYTATILETGTRQPEAMALYEKAGYKRCHCWGKYINSSWSICDRKQLV
ncbi:GNAT family N-acetyltransferase [Brasilonema sp. UFV-L1]|uniref:GNAT family N-acetyltransferase n=1 Tax=Brasilonema sp. UFV-L1 TaxID=2234130 RepID=UPI00145F532B|nr:GNAT family N-acetyltransferase [Brasilonema sp. UFV-L1]NMG09400.1 GNAT family N-acetyltransferase [Brasilonema sp. UFV-L1]